MTDQNRRNDLMLHNGNFAKRTLALLISVALLGAFVSCGSDDKKSKGNKGNNGSVSQATRAADNPNIVEFDDTEDENDNYTVRAGDDDIVTTTTTTAPPRTKKTTTSATTTTTTTAKKTTTTTKATTTTTKATTTTTTTKPASPLSNSYKVVYKTYSSDNGKLKYRYPQISGLYDEAMQSFYNDYFKKSCTGALSDSGLDTFKGTYEVKYKTKDTLSIVFRESYLYGGAAHGYSTAHAITIDLATGNTVIPSEAVDMDKATDAITNDTWTLTRSADGVTKKNVIDYFNQFDEATIRNSLSIDDMIRVKNSGGKYTVTGKAGCNSYLDVNGDPVLILEVNHALGDYVEVQF